MANNITLNTGAGGSVLATEQNGSSEQYQKIKVVDGTAGAFANLWAILASGAAKVDGSGVVQPVSDNGANLHVQGAAASGAAKAGNPLQVGLVFNTTQPTVTTGQAVEHQGTARGAAIVATGADTFNVTVTSAPSTAVTGTFWQATQPVSGTFWQATQPVSGTVTTSPPANASTNVAQLAGTATSVNSGTKDAGTLRVTLATDQVALTNALKVDGSAVTQPVSLTSTTVTGTVAVTESGTWTVQPGNTANTTPWLTTNTPSTSGGLSMHSRLLTADNNLTSVKGSAGQIYGIQAFGTGSAPYWLKIYNKATAPVIASDSALIVKRILVPANATAANGAGVIVPISDLGAACSSGIAYACTGLQGDADTTNTAASGAVNIDYK